MLYAHFDHSFEDCYGVFWDELFEGDQEGGLDGDAAADLGEAVFLEMVSVWYRW